MARSPRACSVSREMRTESIASATRFSVSTTSRNARNSVTRPSSPRLRSTGSPVPTATLRTRS